ncbi:glycosyltransferase family 4 protein [bacterium]|nr:glycosyltransferase family 4 protein [candidate division CSSED10-310 bacterium]
MNILHVDTGLEWRGGQKQVLLLARAQQQRGHEVVIVCPGNGALSKRAGQAGLTTAALAHRNEFDPLAIGALRKLVLGYDPSIIHSHTAHALMHCSAVSLLCGRVPHIHSRRVDFPLRNRFSRLKYRLGVDRIIAISQGVQDALTTSGIEAERIVVVHSGIDPDRVRAEVTGTDPRRSLGIPADAFLVGTVAQLTDHKGHKYLLDAIPSILRDHPGTRFLLAGTGELERELRSQAERLGISESVLFLGFREDISDLLSALDLFVLPSHLEGLCTSLLDAMAMGVPVVATTAGGIPEAVGEEAGLLVPPRQSAALGAAINRLLGDDGRRRAYGQAGRERVERLFRIDRTVDRTLAVYDEVLTERAACTAEEW